VVVAAVGTWRYELQKDVAGGPRAFRIVRAAFTALQSRARFSIAGSVDMGAGKGLADTVAKVHAKRVSRCIANSQISELSKCCSPKYEIAGRICLRTLLEKPFRLKSFV
jgi:hypothetical protein